VSLACKAVFTEITELAADRKVTLHVKIAPNDLEDMLLME
jgi:hypothetical protein